VQAQEGAAQVTAVRSLLAAAICACVLVLVPGAALANGAPSISTTAVVAVEVATDHLEAAADVADRPEAGGVSVKRVTRKPRRTHRRLRVRNGDGFRSGCARAVMRAPAADQMKLKRKRHMGKRSLMRRLMKVRGGLQA
jgi:hypothetical protein